MAEVSQYADRKLSGQVAVVTGAGHGIGEAIARRLGEMGATVVLVARNAKRLEGVKAAIESGAGHAAVLPCDLTDAQQVAELAARIDRDFSRCDILVNNAGVGGPRKPLVELDPEDWDTLMATNLRGPYLMIRALAPGMVRARRGHIINISSLAGKNPFPTGAAYAASKWGLNGLTYSVAEELRQYNVRASVIAPGSVDTQFFTGTGKQPSKMVRPEDIAAIVALLVTQGSNSFISEVLVRPTMKP